jgi:internalin A
MSAKDETSPGGKAKPARTKSEGIASERIAEAMRSGATEIDLRNLGLTTWPERLGEVKQLAELYLDGNQLRELPAALGNLKQLKWLDLGRNQLRELPAALGELKQLQELNLRDNQLRELSASVGELKQLRELRLDRNLLRELPAALGELRQLKQLWLYYNPDLGLPVEVVAKAFSPQEILTYYFSQKKRAEASGTRPLNEAKVLVLGESLVGKSSLIHALTEGLPVPDFAKTHGIVQKPWRLPLREGRLARDGEQGAEELRLNLWDFGGQEVYHSTHAFFLTRRAVYLLVADARANDRQNNLEYWLRMAESFGAGAPVWVAVNKCDQHGAGPDEHALRRKFPAIRGFLRTSCKTGARSRS